MSTSTVTPYQFYEELRRLCPGKFKLDNVPQVYTSPDVMRVLDLFSVFGNISRDVEITAEDCSILPEFTTPEQVVRFVFAAVLASKNNTDVLTQYKELERVKIDAADRLKYAKALDTINEDTILATGIYLLYGYGLLDRLKPVTGELEALVEVQNLLPDDIKGKFRDYTWYVIGEAKRRVTEASRRAATSATQAGGPGLSPLDEEINRLVNRAVDYCINEVKARPGFPIPENVRYLARTSLRSILKRKGITSFDADAIDVSEIDCQAIYDNALAEYEKEYDGNKQFWASSGAGMIAKMIAATLADLISERAKGEVTKAEAESMEQKYREMSEEEEERLSAVEDLLNELYSGVVGERKRIGLKPDQIPDFLMEYLSILNQAGLSPKDYQTLGKMFATFMQLVKEAGLSPKDYQELLNRILVLPSSVRKSVAAAIVAILDKYSSGAIDANEALEEIANVIGAKIEAKPEEELQPAPEVVPQPKPAEVARPKPAKTAPPEETEEEAAETETAEVLRTVGRMPNVYVVFESSDQLWNYLNKHEVREAIIFVYEGLLIIIPRLWPYSDFTRDTVRVIVYNSPDTIPGFLEYVNYWTERFYGNSGYSPYSFGDIIGGRVGIDTGQKRITHFIEPVVELKKYIEVVVQFILRLPGLNACLFYFDQGRLFLLTRNCNVEGRPGSIYQITKAGITELQRRV